jgi:AcrR family transcriptional regulator
VTDKPTSRPKQRYRRLPTGSHGLDPALVREDQRRRLRAAMVELIAAKGYPSVRISDLSRLAHVSPPTLYELYRDKEQLFLATYEDLSRRVVETALSAFAAAETPVRRLEGSLRAFSELAVADPVGVSLVVLGAYGAGARALEHRRRALELLESALHRARGGTGPVQAGDLTSKAIVGGIREVTSNRLRAGRPGALGELAGTLAGWAGCYPDGLPDGLSAPCPGSNRAAGEGDRPSARAQRAEGRLPSGRSELAPEEILNSQRQRIVDATASIVAERGLAGLTIPEISRRANVSNQTFYAIYPSKLDAFLGTQKVGLHQARRVFVDAYERRRGDWPRAIAAGMGALLEYLASEPDHAKLSLVQMYAAGPQAIAVRDTSMRAFSSYLQSGPEPAGALSQEPAVIAEAIVGGIWQVLYDYIEQDSAAALPGAGPQLTCFALAPYLGAARAAAAARAYAGPGPARRSSGGRFARAAPLERDDLEQDALERDVFVS